MNNIHEAQWASYRGGRCAAFSYNLIAARVNSAEITDAVLQIISRLFKKNWDQP